LDLDYDEHVCHEIEKLDCATYRADTASEQSIVDGPVCGSDGFTYMTQ